MPTLTWQRTDGGSQVFRADGPEISIGRDIGNSVQVDSTFVSRRHAVIQGEGKAFTVTDLGSANGTFLNGGRVQSSPLAQGDTIKLGSEELVFALDGAPGRNRARIVLVGLLAVLGLLVAVLFLRSAPDDVPARAETGPVQQPEQPPAGQPAATVEAPPPVAAAPATDAPPSAPPIGAGTPQPAAPTSQASSPPAPGSAEALYDAALAHLRGDRLIEARRLLIEAIEVGLEHSSAPERLRDIEATIQARIEQHLAAGQQQVSYLRFREAILEWEQVVALTDAADPRHEQALEAIERARQRLSGR